MADLRTRRACTGEYLARVSRGRKRPRPAPHVPSPPPPPVQVPVSVPKDEQKEGSAHRRVLFAEVVLGTIGAGTVAATGVSGLPVWAVVLFSAGLTAAT